MLKLSKFVVCRSPIHGRGVFASKTIHKDEIIGVLKGYPTNRPGCYVLWTGPFTGLRITCDLRFLNHADEPNACILDNLELIALEDIMPGTEITHDYEQE